jgi:hypothetical protein
MRFFILFSFLFATQEAHPLEVTLLTQSGSQILKSWSLEELKSLVKHNREISAQRLIIDESTKNLSLNDRADVDLISLYGPKGVAARIPRFMIWRGFLKLELDHGSLNSKSESNRLLVPAEFFRVVGIQKIELSKTSIIYPGTKLRLRTNPAASRGEKLFTQSCLACHGLGAAPKLAVADLTQGALEQFNTKHKTWFMSLDAKAMRGLAAYRDALASEKTEVKSRR